MAEIPFFDRYDADDDDDEGVECKRCGEAGLTWVETASGWRLYDGDVEHRCKYKSAFEDETVSDA